METTTNPTHSQSSVVNGDNGDSADEVTETPQESPEVSEKGDDGVDFGLETGSESTEVNDTENSSRSIDKDNQSYETVDVVVKAKDSQTEADSLDDEVETVIKNQHKYYIYCPCRGEDITKTVKLVKRSDIQPTKNSDTKNEAIETKKDSKSKEQKTKVPSWLPDYLHKLFPIGHKDKGEQKTDAKSPESYTNLEEEPIIVDVEIEKDKPQLPKWFNVDVFAWLFLSIIIALSLLSSSPEQSLPFTPPHLSLPSITSLGLPSAYVLLILPAIVVLLLVIMAMRSRLSPIYHKKKGDVKEVVSNSNDTTSEEQSQQTQKQDGQNANHGQETNKKTENQKVHPAPLDQPPQEQPIDNKDAHEPVDNETQTKSQAILLPNTQPETTTSIETPRKTGANKLEILKSIVYGGLTESITSLCTVTSAAASGASTLNILALGVANLSSGLLLIVHSLQELINQKPRNSEEDEDRYEEILGRREYSKLHKLIAISSFVICGLIPPLVYGFSFRRRIEKRQEYKTLAVYAASLVCIVLLSVAKAYVSKRREYVKTLFRYTVMAMTASGLSQFVGYLVSQWLEKSGFYDDSPRI